jgi:hypothetical protein
LHCPELQDFAPTDHGEGRNRDEKLESGQVFMETCEGKLLKIFGCVVPGEKRLQMRVRDSSDPDEIGNVLPDFPADYNVFLVNESDQDIAMVEMLTGG